MSTTTILKILVIASALSSADLTPSFAKKVLTETQLVNLVCMAGQEKLASDCVSVCSTFNVR